MTTPHHRFLAIGLLAGTFGGLVGLGGGVVMIPLLLLCGLARHQAHATSLVAVIATGLAGAATYARQGMIDLPAALVLAAGAMLAAHAGALAAHRLKADGLRRAFGVLLVAVALLLAAKPWLVAGQVHDGALGSSPAGPWIWVGLSATGLLAGFVAGLLGVGGGGILVPGMVLLAGLDQHTAQGTSLLAMVPAAIVGTWTHARAGAVVGRILWDLVPGILVGTVAGGLAAQHLSEPWLRGIFAVFIAWLGWRDLRPRPARPSSPNGNNAGMA